MFTYRTSPHLAIGTMGDRATTWYGHETHQVMPTINSTPTLFFDEVLGRDTRLLFDDARALDMLTKTEELLTLAPTPTKRRVPAPAFATDCRQTKKTNIGKERIYSAFPSNSRSARFLHRKHKHRLLEGGKWQRRNKIHVYSCQEEPPL